MNEVITQMNNNKDDWSVSNELLELNGEDIQVDKLNALYQFSRLEMYITQDMINKSKHGLMTEEHSAYLKNILTLLKKGKLSSTQNKEAQDQSKDFTVFRHATRKIKRYSGTY